MQDRPDKKLSYDLLNAHKQLNVVKLSMLSVNAPYILHLEVLDGAPLDPTSPKVGKTRRHAHRAFTHMPKGKF